MTTQSEQQKYLIAVMTLASGALYEYGETDLDAMTSHGPLEHIGIAGVILDSAARKNLLDGTYRARRAWVDAVFDQPEDSAVLILTIDDNEDNDLGITIPFTASLTDAHDRIAAALEPYVARHFGTT